MVGHVHLIRPRSVGDPRNLRLRTRGSRIQIISLCCRAMSDAHLFRLTQGYNTTFHASQQEVPMLFRSLNRGNNQQRHIVLLVRRALLSQILIEKAPYLCVPMFTT